MNERFKWCAWFSVTVLVAWPWAVRAAGFDCNQADDPVEKTICASPKLSALDARLSAVYATVLARDPARADALKRDERNWLGERDDQAWQILSDPESESHATRVLTDLYRQRIEFLRNLDNPQDVYHSPLVKAVLKAVPALPKGTSDLLKALQSSGLVVLPQMRDFESLDPLVKALPAPPSPALLKALRAYPDGGPFTLTYLPQVGLGGVINIEGTALCMYWVAFERVGGETRKIKAPRELGGCWNSQGHLALLDGAAVAVNQTTGIDTQDTDLQWRRWWDGKWGIPVRVRVRFDRALKVDTASCDPSLDCRAFRDAALDYARRYDRRPLPATLHNAASLTTAERHEFDQMVAFADRAQRSNGRRTAAAWSSGGSNPDLQQTNAIQHKVDAINQADAVVIPNFSNKFNPSPPGGFNNASSWFPARIDGELALGRIGHGHVGWRLYGFEWLVGFWRLQGDRLVPLAGFVVDRDSGRALLMARMNPQKDHFGY